MSPSGHRLRRHFRPRPLFVVPPQHAFESPAMEHEAPTATSLGSESPESGIVAQARCDLLLHHERIRAGTVITIAASDFRPRQMTLISKETPAKAPATLQAPAFPFPDAAQVPDSMAKAKQSLAHQFDKRSAGRVLRADDLLERTGR